MRHKATVAEHLLMLYELRALRRLAGQGIMPEMVGMEPVLKRELRAARQAANALPGMGDSFVKVATFRDALGHLLPDGAGQQVLDIRRFTPDAPMNIIFMVSFRATLQRVTDRPSTAAVSLEIVLPEEETGYHETVATPTLHLSPGDPNIVRKRISWLSTAEEGTGHGGLVDRPRYTLRITTPNGATGGDVRVSHIQIRVFYITGDILEGGIIE
jgi:hypothetical protein